MTTSMRMETLSKSILLEYLLQQFKQFPIRGQPKHRVLFTMYLTELKAVFLRESLGVLYRNNLVRVAVHDHNASLFRALFLVNISMHKT
mmetsp:Transcript_34020/g.66255  ORF Transcript_34020/g.66255 Transcript_34020/m.66255 type:complete len:89 (-) Transcript_34020:511-777(-)